MVQIARIWIHIVFIQKRTFLNWNESKQTESASFGNGMNFAISFAHTSFPRVDWCADLHPVSYWLSKIRCNQKASHQAGHYKTVQYILAHFLFCCGLLSMWTIVCVFFFGLLEWHSNVLVKFLTGKMHFQGNRPPEFPSTILKWLKWNYYINETIIRFTRRKTYREKNKAIDLWMIVSFIYL